MDIFADFQNVNVTMVSIVFGIYFILIRAYVLCDFS